MPPTNDDFANAITLTGTSGSAVAVDITTATREISEPHSGDIDRTIWYNWTAPANGKLRVNTLASETWYQRSAPEGLGNQIGGFDTVVGVYTGSSVSGLTQVGFNDDYLGTTVSLANVTVTNGTLYRIQVGCYPGTADCSIITSWAFTPTTSSASFAFATCPDAADIYFYNSDFSLRATTAPFAAAEFTTTLCYSRSGTVWGLFEDTDTDLSILRELDPDDGSVIQTISLSIKAGDPQGTRCLHELPDGTLLTVRSSDHVVVKVAIPSGTITEMGLSLDYFDVSVNAAGTEMLYIVSDPMADEATIYSWDLTNDVLGCILSAPPSDVIKTPFVMWPLWLEDGTFLVFDDSWDTEGQFYRYQTNTGALLNTYTYSRDYYNPGVYGFNVIGDHLLVYGNVALKTKTAIAAIDLTTGLTVDVVEFNHETQDDDNDFTSAFVVAGFPDAVGCPPNHQWGGVTAFTHRIANGTIRTSVDLGGQPKGGYKRWRPIGQKKSPKLPVSIPPEPPVEGGITIAHATQTVTIAAAAFTDTLIQLPDAATIIGVSVEVKVTIPTATTFDVGDAGNATRFSTASVSTAAGSSDPGTKAGAYYNTSATAVRLTMNGGTPATNVGRVRVTISYLAPV